MRKKLCVYPSCKSDSRYYHKSHMKDIFFIPFPKAKKNFIKYQKWFLWLNRIDYPLSRVNDNTYICSKHFVGGKGPTEQFPDPIHNQSEYVSILKRGIALGQHSSDDHAALETQSIQVNPEIDIDEDISIPVDNPSISKANGDIPCLNSVNATNLYSEEIQESNIPATNLHKLIECFTFPSEWATCERKDSLTLYKFREGTNSVIYSVTLDERFIAKYEVLGRSLEGKDKFKLPDIINSKVTLKNILLLFDGYKLCSGNNEPDMLQIFENRVHKNGYINPTTGGIHSMECQLLLTDRLRLRCFYCAKQRLSFHVTISRIKKKSNTSISKFSNLNKEQLAQKLRRSKMNEILMKRKLKRLQIKMIKEITKSGKEMEVSDQDHGFLLKILDEGVTSEHDKNTNDFSRLFLRTQLKMLKEKNKNRRRWHPLVVQWCLFMYAKSPSLYKALSESGVLILPSKSTLARNADTTGSSPGFYDDVFVKMKKDFENSKKFDHEDYFVLVMDEIKIEKDLVFRVETGDVIGYTHLSDTEQKLSELQSEIYKEKPLATHVLQFMLRGVTNGFQRPFAHFATHSLKAETLDALLWEAIQKLELSGFKILAVIGDGAAINRKCFDMNCKEYSFKCKNPFNSNRDLFFICDVPHLIKTVRNCLERSREIGGSRLMQINEEILTWNILQDLFKKDMNEPGNLRKLHKLTTDHLTVENRMKVKFATQILSQSVANALKTE